MTLLSDPQPHRAAPVPAAGPVRRRPSTTIALLRAVTAAVASLDEVDYGPSTYAARRHLDQMLRDAVDRHLERVGEDGPVAAVPAVRVACAHLAAGDLEDAYLALLTARDLLR
ncbi:hypothetical protein LQ327_31700 [Actinomycetospora endophytica]|uniref:Uncharacterized protein n=1 Tax=Actinomycetospora endophytica TaxID=2291215 RepID=A0ABS8PKB8_9PSEU|nr:hypothetical protein [Actinomycetospora endophytica]MCD2197945.1 hypothetical protein [Actinomycetospora endophytica]